MLIKPTVLKYQFSFTATSALISDFVLIAKAKKNGIKIVPSILGREKSVTNKRHLSEFSKRLKSLTSEQLDILCDGNSEEQKQITHLALCKTYRFYFDFVSDILSEKVKTFDMHLTDMDYNSFIRKKEIEHDELYYLADSTKYKVKQVTILMLHQVGFIDSITNPYILVPDINIRVKDVILRDNPAWLRCFLNEI